MTKKNAETEQAISRRAMSAMTALVGLGYLSACEGRAGAGPSIGSSHPALFGSGSSVWADAIGTSSRPLDLRFMAPGAQPLPDDAAFVIVRGFWEPDDGGGGVFAWSNDTTTPDDGGTVIVPVANTRIGCWKRITGERLNVKWFGVKAARGTFSTAEASYDLALADANSSALSAAIATTQPLYFPPGLYPLRTIELNSPVDIEGSVGGGGTEPKTWLVFDGAENGFWFHQFSRWSSVRNLGVVSTSITNPDSHAFRIRTIVELERCTVRKWGGNGIDINSADGSEPPAVGGLIIADLCHISRCWISECENGVYTRGGDSNVCLFEHVSVVVNRGWGVWDQSFLGNHYVHCHAATNGAQRGGTYADPGGAYKIIGDTNTTVLENCYAEEDNYCEIAGRVQVRGGTVAALRQFKAGTLVPSADRAVFGYTEYSHRLRGLDYFGGAYGELGGSNVFNRPTALGWGMSQSGHVWRLWRAAAGLWEFNFAALNGGTVLRFYEPGGTNNHPRGMVDAHLPKGAWIGVESTYMDARDWVEQQQYRSIRICPGVKAPTGGAWTRGDVVIHCNPSDGDPFGWRCIASGTPGSWQPILLASSP